MNLGGGAGDDDDEIMPLVDEALGATVSSAMAAARSGKKLKHAMGAKRLRPDEAVGPPEQPRPEPSFRREGREEDDIFADMGKYEPDAHVEAAPKKSRWGAASGGYFAHLNAKEEVATATTMSDRIDEDLKNLSRVAERIESRKAKDKIDHAYGETYDFDFSGE